MIATRSPQPYPKPRGLSRNVRYARILQSLYSGNFSELTAIHQYIYHQIITEREYPQLAALLNEIAAVETVHLKMLGECILELGLHPIYSYYQGTRRARWNAGFVQYARGAKSIIDISLHTEQQAIESYYCAIRCIVDEQITALLRRIIEDEELHIKALADLRGRM